MNGRAAIVTGAASGIGRAIATDLAAQGTRVLFADVNVAEGERVAADFSTAVFQRADIAKQADCEALVARAVREFGRVDILVNNAGLQHVAPVEKSRATRSPSATFTSAKSTRVPCAARSVAIARPMPLAAPVTMAARPFIGRAV